VLFGAVRITDTNAYRFAIGNAHSDCDTNRYRFAYLHTGCVAECGEHAD
jgi:hypothetical protein